MFGLTNFTFITLHWDHHIQESTHGKNQVVKDNLCFKIYKKHI